MKLRRMIEAGFVKPIARAHVSLRYLLSKSIGGKENN